MLFMKKGCLFCKKPIEDSKKYCNQKCMALGFKKKKAIIKCVQCGKEKETFPCFKHRRFCSKQCSYDFNKGKKRPEHSEKMKGRISPFRGKKLSESHREKLRGENSPRWRGGITHLYHKIRRLPEYDLWRKVVFARDSFCCIWCFEKDKRIEADHIKPFSAIIILNNIKTVDDAIKCSELWDPNNGRTLCRDCHKLTDSYGKNYTKN